MKLQQITNNIFYTKKPTAANNKPQNNAQKYNSNPLAPLKQDSVSFTEKYKYNLTLEETIEMFKYLGIKSEILQGNKLAIERYFPKKKDVELLERAGMDEDSLFQHVYEIWGDCYLVDSKLKSLHNVRVIGEDFIGGPFLKDIGDLKGVEGYADFSHTNISDIRNLHYVGSTFRHYLDIELPPDFVFGNVNYTEPDSWGYRWMPNNYKRHAKKYNL